jgi:hypothetical protein
MLTTTVKGTTRKFRKALRAAGHPFLRTGAFHVKVNGTTVTNPADLPATADLKRAKITHVIGAGTHVIPYVAPVPVAPAPVADADRTLYKRTVREADPAKPNSKRRVDYKPARNPKPDDGVTYYAKIDGKWRDVPAAYADPSYNLPGTAAA